jgi:hypothetical protein
MFNKGKFIKIGLYGPKTGSKLGVTGPKHSINHSIAVTFIKIGCLQWSYLGCMTQKQGPNWGYWAQNGVINWVVIPSSLNQGQIWVMGPKTGSEMGCSPKNLIYGRLLGIRAFGCTGFSVVGLLGIRAFR